MSESKSGYTSGGSPSLRECNDALPKEPWFKLNQGGNPHCRLRLSSSETEFDNSLFYDRSRLLLVLAASSSYARTVQNTILEQCRSLSSVTIAWCAKCFPKRCVLA